MSIKAVPGESFCVMPVIVTSTVYSVLEMVQAFESASGKKLSYRMSPRRAGDVAECYANPAKAGELLKWAARRSLDDMCASAWRFQQSAEKRENP